MARCSSHRCSSLPVLLSLTSQTCMNHVCKSTSLFKVTWTSFWRYCCVEWNSITLHNLGHCSLLLFTFFFLLKRSLTSVPLCTFVAGVGPEGSGDDDEEEEGMRKEFLPSEWGKHKCNLVHVQVFYLPLSFFCFLLCVAALVKVGLSFPSSIGVCKAVRFKLHHSGLNQESTHKVMLVIII